MDAFFASIEERDKPRLKGLPIVVGSDPKDGNGRGVVSTANYAARKYGIHSAQPIGIAWSLSEKAAKNGNPKAIFIEPDIKKYSKESKNIISYIKTKAKKVEQASIDEAYIECEKENQSWEKAENFAKEIKKYIKEKNKLTCSIGIGPNKLIAKMASSFKKPDGLTIITDEDVKNFLDPKSVGDIPGIGPKTESVLKRMKIETIRDLKNISREKLIEKFGKWGAGMFERSRGIDTREVEEDREIKSIGEQETFEKDTLDSVILIEKLKEICSRVQKRVEKNGLLFKTVTIIVRFENFETKTRSHTVKTKTNSLRDLEGESLQMFLPFLDSRENPNRKKIRLLGVRVEKLIHR